MHTDLTVAQIVSLFAAADSRGVRRLLREHGEDPRAGVRAACAAATARLHARLTETSRTKFLYELESSLYAQGLQAVAGVDEVGRGALAGPLTVAAVVLAREPRIEGLDDSKRLTPARRRELAAHIHAQATAVSIHHVPAEQIDSLGITAALKIAVISAVARLPIVADHVLLDGHPLRTCEHETAIVKGDSKVAAIAAASIVAKVARDALMCELAGSYPAYGFEVNKGYGTPEHLAALARTGPSAIHRRSFSAGGGTMSLF